jgi:hypothetical protein
VAATPQLLVGPSGVWVLRPGHQRGTITYSKGRWHQKGGNLYMKIFAQESLGRPDLEINGEIQSIHNYLSKHLPEDKVPPVQAALVFTNPKVEIRIDDDENPPAETVHITKLKDQIRKSAKVKPIPLERVKLIQDTISS